MKLRTTLIIVASFLVCTGYLFLSKPKADRTVQRQPISRFAAAEGKVEIAPGCEVEICSELEGRIEAFHVTAPI